MTNPTNWPYPNRPGVPMFPEREGWHVIDARSGGSTVLAYWNGKEWSAGDCVRGLNSSPEWWHYNGAVLTPTQITEMLAAERERCAKEADKHRSDANPHAVSDWDVVQTSTANDIAKAIRNLGYAP